MHKDLYKEMGISEEVYLFCEREENNLVNRFKEIDVIAEYNQMKVLKAMQDNRLSDIHFSATTGYGYNDLGRDIVEKVYADVFKAEDALVRPQLISGTNALYVALSSNLRPGDEMLSPIGKPYDTLEEVIGIRETVGSLAEFGITYNQVEFKENYEIDYDGIEKAINERTKLILIQRSKGYDNRPTLSVEQIKEIITFVKKIKPELICMVDNCYGEFVDVIEPVEVGADMAVGSLIKNPGGGLAPVGGYIVGTKSCVEKAANRLSAPGLGKEVGPTLGLNTSTLQGLFLAPNVVSGAVKGAIFAANIFEILGYEVIPNSVEKRNDIVQAINFESPEAVIAFCKGIQKAAPVDSFVSPEPWDMPGYDSPVIMAAGCFVQGSSIELSADGPIKPPYTAFLQGGLTWYHAKLGVMMGVQQLVDRGVISYKVIEELL